MVEAITPSRYPWHDYTRYSFSLGLRAGSDVYLSGHTATRRDPDSGRMVASGSMAAQARTAYDKIIAILEGAGGSLQDVVRIVEYVRPEGIDCYAEAAAVRTEMFGAHRPTVNTVPVQALLRPEALIEVEVTARIGAPDQPRVSSGVVYLPSVLPLDAAGGIVGRGDVAAQTQAIFERAGEMLRALGLDFDRVVKTVDYFTPDGRRDYRQTGSVRKSFFGPVYPAAVGIIMPRLMHKDALIQYDFIASRDEPELINPGWARFERFSYSPGVRAGKLLFMSGQGAIDPEAGQALYGGDIAAQAEYTYGNILKVVEAAGGNIRNLIKTIEYVTPAGLAQYRDVGAVRTRCLSQPYPASTGVVCGALLRPELAIEIDPFAILD